MFESVRTAQNAIFWEDFLKTGEVCCAGGQAYREQRARAERRVAQQRQRGVGTSARRCGASQRSRSPRARRSRVRPAKTSSSGDGDGPPAGRRVEPLAVGAMAEASSARPDCSIFDCEVATYGTGVAATAGIAIDGCDQGDRTAVVMDWLQVEVGSMVTAKMAQARLGNPDGSADGARTGQAGSKGSW